MGPITPPLSNEVKMPSGWQPKLSRHRWGWRQSALLQQSGKRAYLHRRTPAWVWSRCKYLSERYVLSAWHCVREAMLANAALWFRIRVDGPRGRQYAYIPMRVSNYDAAFDVAVLAVDEQRVPECDLTASEIERILTESTIQLGVEARVNEKAQTLGFPANSTSADCDTNSAEVVETALPLGDVVGLKLFGPAFAAVNPVDPHGMSGGPVLRTSNAGDRRRHVAIGVIRAVPRGSISRGAAGGGIIATRVEDVAETLPEVAMALSSNPDISPRLQDLASSHGHNVLEIANTCRQALRDSVVMVEDTGRGKLLGWAHFFDEPPAHRRPTAVSTAYGLKLALALDEPDGRLNRSELAETLWKLQLPDNGWAARTGSGIGRPEVTALVLGALASAGCGATRLAIATTLFEEALASDADPVVRERTHALCAAIRGLVRVRPQSQHLPELREALLAGAIRDFSHGNLLCWSSRLRTEGPHPPVPSVPHTAIAIVSLCRANHVLGADAPSRAALEEAVQWLSLRRSLDNQTEQIRRFVSDGQPWELV